jgi:hypothetical protein
MADATARTILRGLRRVLLLSSTQQYQRLLHLVSTGLRSWLDSLFCVSHSALASTFVARSGMINTGWLWHTTVCSRTCQAPFQRISLKPAFAPSKRKRWLLQEYSPLLLPKSMLPALRISGYSLVRCRTRQLYSQVGVMMEMSILIADDHPLFREALKDVVLDAFGRSVR